MTDFAFSLQDKTETPLIPSTDGVFEHNTQHAEQAIDHLIEIFKHGPRSQVVLSAVMAQMQELEDTIFETLGAFDIDTAVEIQLDMIGGFVGETRKGRVDDDYRVALRVAVLANKSHGTIPQILEILTLMFPGGAPTAYQPATMHLRVDVADLGDVTFMTLITTLKKAKAAGVRLLLVHSGDAALGSSDGSPAGGVLGSYDGDPAGFVLGSGS